MLIPAQADVLRYTRRLRHQDPPNLRSSNNMARQCSNCLSFYLLRSEGMTLHGECLLYDTFVRGNFLCEDFTPLIAQTDADDTDQTPSDT